MTDDALHRISFEIEHRLYYLEYPNVVPPGFWKDGNGQFIPIESMKLDHLKASIQRLQKDRAAFLKAYKGAKHERELIDSLLPLIDAKQNELRAALIKSSSL